MSQLTQLRRELAQLNQQLNAAQDARDLESNDATKVVLQNQVNFFMQKIAETHEKIRLFESGQIAPLDPDEAMEYLERLWQKHQVDINFSREFRNFKNLMDDFDGHGYGAALFLLPNYRTTMADLYVRRIEDWLSHNVGESGYLLTYPYWLKRHQSNPQALIAEFLQDFQLTDVGEFDEQIEMVRTQICGRMESGNTQFIRINLDGRIDETFLSWFLEDFWHPIVEEVVQRSQNQPFIRMVAFLSLKHELPDSIHQNGLCNPQYAADHFTLLPLSKWQTNDILYWLKRHSGLLKYHISLDSLGQIAESVGEAIANENAFGELEDLLYDYFEKITGDLLNGAA